MQFWQVDSFTDRAFAGNPAVVVILTEDIPDERKQNIAMEMNLSETAYVLKQGPQMEIRWFTPDAEVDICGHATLAAAHILWSEGFIDSSEIEFSSKSGMLGVRQQADAYVLDFPAQPPIEKPEYSGRMESIIAGDPLVYIGSNSGDCMVELTTGDAVRRAEPNLDQIQKLPERGLLVTAQDGCGAFDYIYRAFFPKLGIPEDPVTGSANTLLAPYWSKKLNKQKLKAYQASKRGGELALEVGSDRVFIAGKAITVISGDIMI